MKNKFYIPIPKKKKPTVAELEATIVRLRQQLQNHEDVIFMLEILAIVPNDCIRRMGELAERNRRRQ